MAAVITKPITKKISDLAEFDVTPRIDHVQWYAHTYYSEKAGLISHEDFKDWVESKGYLDREMVSYELCDVVQWTISYTDLLLEDDINEVVFQYLIEKKLI